MTQEKEVVILDSGAFNQVPFPDDNISIDTIANHPDYIFYTTTLAIKEARDWIKNKDYKSIMKKQKELENAIKEEENIVNSIDYQLIQAAEEELIEKGDLKRVDPIVRKIIYFAGMDNIGIDASNLKKDQKHSKQEKIEMALNEIESIYNEHKILFNELKIYGKRDGNKFIFGELDASGFLKQGSIDWDLNKEEQTGKGSCVYTRLNTRYLDSNETIKALVSQLRKHKASHAQFYNAIKKTDTMMSYFNAHPKQLLTDDIKDIVHKSERYLSKCIIPRIAEKMNIKELDSGNREALLLAINSEYIDLFTNNGMHNHPDFCYDIMIGQSMDKVQTILDNNGTVLTNNTFADKKIVSNAIFNPKLVNSKNRTIWTTDIDIPQFLYGIRFNQNYQGESMDVSFKMFASSNYTFVTGN